ncbi:hypothetical protein ACQKM2_15525 [Streptomyces sp. NPDC004126]|uniref:hypothetical protein n=1 Tax=Streptomyces sp. NPDC004126 TaxID=3390695 RepID=UPI003CFCEF13
MVRDLMHSVWVSWLLLLAPLWGAYGTGGGFLGAGFTASLVAVGGVLPAHALARWRGWGRLRLPQWAVYALAAAVWSAVLGFLMALFIMMLPHGWGSMSWGRVWFWARLAAVPVIPASVVSRLLIQYVDWLRNSP